MQTCFAIEKPRKLNSIIMIRLNFCVCISVFIAYTQHFQYFTVCVRKYWISIMIINVLVYGVLYSTSFFAYQQLTNWMNDWLNTYVCMRASIYAVNSEPKFKKTPNKLTGNKVLFTVLSQHE